MTTVNTIQEESNIVQCRVIKETSSDFTYELLDGPATTHFMPHQTAAAAATTTTTTSNQYQ